MHLLAELSGKLAESIHGGASGGARTWGGSHVRVHPSLGLARWLACIGLGLVTTHGATLPTLGAAPTLTPIVVWIPEEYHTGGAYTAIQAGPDGRVYLGTTFYDGFARFLALPPGGQQFQLIANMASATGELTPGPYAQAKIHTKPVVAPDGKVYFGTKSGKPAKDERWQASYPGGHLLVYDPQTNRTSDLGIIRPRQSIIAVGVDPQRSIVYALTDPDGHLNIYDPLTRTFSDKGVLSPGPAPTRYLVVLANGDAVHPAGADAFIRYRAASGTIERLPLQFSGRGSYESPYALAASPDGTRFHGVGEDSGQVYTFMPGDRAIAVQLHGAAAPEGYSQRSNHYTMTAAPDGNMYYTDIVLAGPPEGTLFLMRLVTRTGQPEIVGQVGSLPPPPVPLQRRTGRRLMVQGSTASPDGTLYVMLAYPLRVLIFPRLASRP